MYPRVLVVDMEFDYGVQEMGRSFGYYNILLPLQELLRGRVSFFDHLERLRTVGKQRMNDELYDLVRRTRPEITIIVLYTDQFTPELVRSLSTWTTSVGYFYDDIWRDRYADFWARQFDLITTPMRAGVAKYARAGIHNAIHCPFAFNESLYRKAELPQQYEYDVSFVGGYHPYREWLMSCVRRAGHEASAFGPGWPSGKLSFEEMIRVFNTSRINLNISNSAQWEPRYVLSSVKALKWTLRTSKRREQVKGRHFEIAGCGGFQMSYHVVGLDDYFEIGREIVTYRGSHELLSKIAFYLRNETERRTIADRGWQRAQREHTARARLSYLLDEVLRRRSTGAVGAANPPPGVLS